MVDKPAKARPASREGTSPRDPSATSSSADKGSKHSKQPAYNMRQIITIFSGLMMTMLMSSLGQTIFATALPTIVGELGGVDKTSWVISAFLVAMTVALPISGKLGDRLGRKPVYLTAIVIFLIGSTVGGFAHTMDLLIVGRIIQGLGAGGLMISSQSIVAEVIPARQRGKFMGIIGAVFGLSSVLGPVLGGWITDGPGWRWGLWINIPIGLIALVVCVFALRLRRGERSIAGYDWLGTLFLAIGTTALILMTTWGGTEYEWTDPLIWGLGIAFLVAAIIFVFVETRAKYPLIPMRLFKNRNMTLTTVAGTFMGISMFGVLAYMPTYLQMVHTMTPTQAGLMMIPMMVGVIGTSTSVGFIISNRGRYKIFPLVGLAIVAVALLLLSTMSKDTSLVRLGVYLFIFGFGLGLAVQVLVLIVQNAFPISEVGTATAANNFFRQIGGAVGASLAGSLFFHNIQNEMSERLPEAIKQMGPEGAAAAKQLETAGGVDSLTPEAVADMPAALRDAVLISYNEGLTPVFQLMVPLVLLAFVAMLPIREDELKETVD